MFTKHDRHQYCSTHKTPRKALGAINNVHEKFAEQSITQITQLMKEKEQNR